MAAPPKSQMGAILSILSSARLNNKCGITLVTFLGTTRDHHGGRRVRELSYEAYEPMALEFRA